MSKSGRSLPLDSDSDDTFERHFNSNNSTSKEVSKPAITDTKIYRNPRLFDMSDSDDDNDSVVLEYDYARPKYGDFFDLKGGVPVPSRANSARTASVLSSTASTASGRKSYASGYQREAMDFELNPTGRDVPDWRPTVLPLNINLSADVDWKRNWKLLPYVPDPTPGKDHYHYGGVAAVHRYPPSKKPKIELGVVRFAMPRKTHGKTDFDPENPGVLRGTHESLRLQCLIYLREHWDGVADLEGQGSEIDVRILRDYCPEVVFLICQSGLDESGEGPGGMIHHVQVDFNAGHPEVAKIIAERIEFKYRGRKLTFVGSNLKETDTLVRLH